MFLFAWWHRTTVSLETNNEIIILLIYNYYIIKKVTENISAKLSNLSWCDFKNFDAKLTPSVFTAMIQIQDSVAASWKLILG